MENPAEMDRLNKGRRRKKPNTKICHLHYLIHTNTANNTMPLQIVLIVEEI